MTVCNVAVFAAIIYAQIVTAFNDSEHQALKVQINDAKHAKAFSTLLNSIVNVNKERYDTLKKMTRLQQFPPYPPRNALRGGESEDSSEEDTDEDSEPEIVAYLVLPQQELENSQTEDEDEFRLALLERALNTSSTSQEEETLRTQEIESALRSCHKRGTKKCKWACKEAVRATCHAYSCHGHMRKKFRKECKRACKDSYGYDSDSD